MDFQYHSSQLVYPASTTGTIYGAGPSPVTNGVGVSRGSGYLYSGITLGSSPTISRYRRSSACSLLLVCAVLSSLTSIMAVLSSHLVKELLSTIHTYIHMYVYMYV